MEGPLQFDEVFEKELEAVSASREARTGEAGRDERMGLALSGGGIRSATFNLGVIQGLARLRLLHRLDYISTVSGGGYIGGWLQAWSKRAGGIAAVEETLRSNDAPPQLGFLRRFSNYLTPKRGLFSADTWTAVATYLRNLLLTQAALLPVLGLLVLLPWLAVRVSRFVAAHAWLGTGLGFAGLLAGCTLIGAGAARSQVSLQRRIVLPYLLAAWLGACGLWSAIFLPQPGWFWVLLGAGAYFAAFLCAHVATRLRAAGEARGLIGTARGLWTALLAGLAGGVPLWGVASVLRGFDRIEAVAAFGTPLVTLVFAFALVVHLGLMGRRTSHASLEWWSRLGAWVFIYNLAWTALFAVVLYGPFAFDALESVSLTGTHVLWIATTVGGVLLGRSPKTGEGARRVPELLVAVAPYVFFAAVLALLSRGYSALHAGFGAAGLWALLPALLALLYLVRELDINRFSMHVFYRNRLVRCYLGASNADRREDPITGFDERDDLPLADLDVAKGPLPIVNAALNLVGGDNLAWQERRAASFTLTPLHCGFEFPRTPGSGGYRSARDWAGGPTLGTAVATSGAAASPNMGYHSSPAAALLLTLFNVRLGLWAANPRHDATWRLAGPRLGVWHLLREMLGLTDDASRFVYLSDGAHFENLAVYELVRRRCRFVVACDCGQDAGLAFDDLGNLIRKCRTDHGVEIDVDVAPIRLDEQGRSRWHCAVGKIRYPDAPPGFLLYLKPSLSGDEPADVTNYARRNEAFPHQSTGDQWFDESQFESYRKLGLHVATTVLEEAAADATPLDVETLFVRLRERWYPPAPTAGAFSRHAQALDGLLERLRKDDALGFLKGQIWPEWERLTSDVEEPPEIRLWLPPTLAARDQAFHYCLSILHLMENVYVDLDLEQHHGHPDHRGWMNLFRHWSWSGMLRVTWAIAASTYGARFQTFLRRHLDLDLGAVVVEERKPAARGAVATRIDRMLDRAYRELELNFFEIELIRSFVDAHPECARGLSVQLLRLRVRHPDEDVAESISFTFGFALVREKKLLYLRVQDHLRKMGLGRRGLKALFEAGVVDARDLRGMPETAREVPTEEDRDRFEALYRSVQLERE